MDSLHNTGSNYVLLHEGQVSLAAVLLAMTALCHLLPTIFAVVGALLLFVLRPGKTRAKFLAAILAVGGLLAAFWSVPFLARMPYANNMGWEKLTEYSKNLLRWNGAEGSWDCPCHGSRFDVDGEVLEGPAVNALERRQV